MIGRAEWFERRKYGGWGLHPRTWQGWAYVFIFMAILVAFQSMPFWNTTTRVAVTAVWITILLVDVVDIMIHMKRDERETKIEAISERNAAWTMSILLTIALVYQIIISGLNQSLQIDWWIAAALIAGVIAKSISNFTLERRVI